MAVYVDTALAQFENTNSLRTYPFAWGSSLVDSVGRELPKDVIVDVHMFVPADIEASDNLSGGDSSSSLPDVRLVSVHLSPFMVSACFRSESSGKTSSLSVTVARGNFEPYRPYRMEKLYGCEDVGGMVTFGNLDFPGFPETHFLSEAVIHPCCIAPAKPAALRRITDLRSGNSVSGDVRIDFSQYVVSSRDGRSYTLSLEDGADVELASECIKMAGLDQCGATPIATINGVRPDADGNIVLWFH